MLKPVLFIPREHAVGGPRRWTAAKYGPGGVPCGSRVRFRPRLLFFFLSDQPNPNPITLTLTDDRPPIEGALVKF